MMIGNMIRNVRIKKNMTMTQLADLTGINLGHLSHIEKGDRNPSYKNLKLICEALDTPITEFVSKLDEQLEEEQEIYGYVNYIPYNKIPLVDIAEYIDIPDNISGNTIAIRIKDDSMKTKFQENDIIYIEMGKPVSNGDIGIFSYNGKILIRKFRYMANENKIKLEALNKDYNKICINDNDEFYIIGKVI